MAHGFLTPTPVSGDNFWRNVEWLWKKLNKEKEEKEKGGALATTPKPDIYDQELKAVRVSDVTASKAQKNEPPALKMLKQSIVAGALKPGTSGIVKREQLALPPGGPRLPGGASPTKGGTFTNIPGISAAPKKLDSEVFFKAAQTGVDPETGRYLSSEERKDYLKKSKSQLNATASVASAGASGISSASLVTKGDEAVVGSVENLTKVVTSLVDAVKAQTAAQKQISDKEAAKADTLANRALAREEEKALEEGTDNSGFITPAGGMGSLTGGGSSSGGGGGLGLGTALGAAGKIIGKAAPGIGARGAARALPRAGAAVAGKGGAKALMKIGGKTAARMIPGAQTAIGLGMAGEALSRGDILGAALSAGSAIPGPIGWGFLAADVARDVSGGGKGMARGGLVTGGKKSVVDDVPIRADEGEVVMSNAAGNAWGRGTLLAMNAMGGGSNKPTGGKGYAEGGLVGGDKAKSKQMFKMFGEGMIDAQKANSRDFARIQSQGLKQYYENEGGGDQLGKSLIKVFSKVTGVLGALFGGTLTSLLGGPAQAAPSGNPADYLDGGIGGSTAERNAAAFLSTLEGGGGQTAADTFQVMLNRTSNAKAGGSMKAYGTTLFDQLTAREQFSPFSAAIYGASADSAAAKKYGPITKALGSTPEERKKKLLEIAGQPDGLAALQKLFKAGSAAEASKVLADFETSGAMSKSSAQFVGGAMSFRGYETAGSRRRSQGGNYFFGAAQGTKAASLNAVSAAPENVLNTGRLPALPATGTMHGQAYGANRRGGRKHAGVDFDIRGNEKFFSRIGGTVVKIGYDPSGYGNYVDIYNEQLKVTERIAEGAKVLVQQGQKVSAGTPIVQGETNTGVIHYEIRKGSGYGFEGSLNPLNFLSSVSSKNKDTASAKPTGSGGGRGGQRGSGSSPGSLQAAPASPNTGASLAQASGQVSMMAMGMNTPTGNIINNIYGGPGGQQASPTSNALSPGQSASNTLFNWKAARR
jgi:murein DD-endopeptidase MepM/ murein hydrolase activator NlpD